MIKKKLAGVRRLIEDGFIEEAGVAIARMRPRIDGLKEFEELMEIACDIALGSQDAAVLVGERHFGTNVYLPVPTRLADKAVVKALRKAENGDDHGLAVRATSLIGCHLIGQSGGKSVKEGIQKLNHARRSGDLDATLALADHYRTSGGRSATDINSAMMLYAQAIEEHDDGSARYFLARMMIDYGVDFRHYDVNELMEEAAGYGIEEAEDYLESLPRELESDDLPDVPYTVVPADPIRLRMARNALMSAYGATRGTAEAVVAAMHGHFDWENLVDDARTREAPNGPFDEDVDPEVRDELREAQAEILIEAFDLTPGAADVAVGLLALTSKGRLPDLSELRPDRERRN
jgi:hypothetical protein